FGYAPPTGVWTHLAVVVTATDTKLYVNGVLQSTLGPLQLGSDAGANFVIGGTGEGPGGDNDPFKGCIDEVRIYNQALSDSNIMAVYNFTGGSPPADTTAPTVAITSPANGSTVSGTVTVSANALDNVSVAGVQFKLDGANLG